MLMVYLYSVSEDSRGQAAVALSRKKTWHRRRTLRWEWNTLKKLVNIHITSRNVT